MLPRGEFSVLETYVRALRSAQRLIYLENQFLWSPEIVAILEAKLRHPPCDDFRVVVLLPHKANNGQDDTRGMLGRLVAADDGATASSPPRSSRARGERSGPLYVHAKIGIVDDAWLAIGSANLNEHCLFNDTEVDVVTCDPRARPRDAPAAVGASTSSATTSTATRRRSSTSSWRPIATEQLERRRARRAARPTTSSSCPGVSRRSRRLLGPLDALVVDG